MKSEKFANGSFHSCAVLIQRLKDESRYWFCFTQWKRESGDYDLAICRNKLNGSIVGLNVVSDENTRTTLDWTYIPKKQKDKKRNEERKKIFIELAGNVTQKISLPNDHHTLNEFIEKIFTLVQNREKAENLDQPGVDL